jgi:NitT/TauT family transport system permease protein
MADDTKGKGAPAPTWTDAKDAAETARARALETPAKKPEKKSVPMYGDGNRETIGGDEIARPPPWWKRLRTEPPVPIRMALGSVLVALVFLVWFGLTHSSSCDLKPDPRKPWIDVCGYTRAVSPAQLPSPGEVWRAIGGYQVELPASECPGNGDKPCTERRQSIWDRNLSDSIFITLQRVFLGVGLAALIGVLLGVIAGSMRSVSAALGPIVIFVRSVPMSALLFLTLLMFGGIGEKQKTLFIFLAVVPFVFSDTIKAIAIVPERYVETAQTLGASRFQIIWKVLVPLAIPDVITSLRFQFGLALGYITLAESIGKEGGLGTLIESSQAKGPFEHVILLLFIIAFIAYGIDLVLRTIQRGAFAWRKDL